MSAPANLARSWSVIEALAGHSYEGLRLTQVAGAVQQPLPTTLRDLQALESLGRVERIPGKDGCWRLSPRVIQLAIAHQHELARLSQRVVDFTNRYSRNPS